MLCETVYLREKENNNFVRLLTYVSGTEGDMCNAAPRDAVLVLPGGAYVWHAEREAEPVVKQFLAAGFNAFTLYYSVGLEGDESAKFPRPVVDVSMAIAHIKRNAKKYNINPDRVFVCGFSAGGHLCGSIGTFWNRDWASFDGMEKGENRPCGVILSYPVVTNGELGHDVSTKAMCGEGATQEIKDAYSLEKQVTEDTVPHFIWQTQEDDCVPVENSMLLASALIEKKIPVELHIYPKGPHGMSISNGEVDGGNPVLNDPHVSGWMRECIEWTKII